MGARHGDRLWMIAGAAGTALLLALGWLLLISPTNADADGLRQQSSDTQQRLGTLRHRLAELQQQKAKLAEYRAALKTNQAALPTDSGVPDFLRQLQASGDAVDVSVSGMSVSASEADSAVPNVYDLPITVTADGTAVNLGRFLNQLQAVQPRAVLIESASLSSSNSTKADTMGISIRLRVFVAATAGASAKTGTTTTN